MKNLIFISIFSISLVGIATGLLAQDTAQQQAPTNSISIHIRIERSKRELLKKYDLNCNGKIDVPERQGYVRELSSITRAYLKEESQAATNRVSERGKKIDALDNMLLREDGPLLRKYDSNKNGRLDKEELKQARQDRLNGETRGSEIGRPDKADAPLRPQTKAEVPRDLPPLKK